jgi:hypothetical protein
LGILELRMNAPLLASFLYLLLGMGTTSIVWVAMPDEIEMAISLDLEDEAERPILRFLITVFFVLGWPLVLLEVFNRK